jgi:hypothetical protein
LNKGEIIDKLDENDECLNYVSDISLKTDNDCEETIQPCEIIGVENENKDVIDKEEIPIDDCKLNKDVLPELRKEENVSEVDDKPGRPIFNIINNSIFILSIVQFILVYLMFSYLEFNRTL